MYLIKTDGASKGNPGDAACAFAVWKDDKLIHTEGFFLEIETCNVAEYWGAIYAFNYVLENALYPVSFAMDSLLVVNQLNGLWQIKEKLKRLHFVADGYLTAIRSRSFLSFPDNPVTVVHILREYNSVADAECNRIIKEYRRSKEESSFNHANEGPFSLVPFDSCN